MDSFGPPFEVEIRAGTYQSVRSAVDAAEVMTFHWPPRGKPRLASSSRKKRLAALHACIAALEQTGFSPWAAGLHRSRAGGGIFRARRVTASTCGSVLLTRKERRTS